MDPSENVPPRKVYDAAMSQRTILDIHIPRVRERVARYDRDSWEHVLQEVDLARWCAVRDVLDAICNGKTVQPS